MYLQRNFATYICFTILRYYVYTISYIDGIQDGILKEDHHKSLFRTLMSLSSSLSMIRQVAVAIFDHNHTDQHCTFSLICSNIRWIMHYRYIIEGFNRYFKFAWMIDYYIKQDKISNSHHQSHGQGFQGQECGLYSRVH